MNRFLPLVTCLFVGLAATLVSSCARYVVSEPVLPPLVAPPPSAGLAYESGTAAGLHYGPLVAVQYGYYDARWVAARIMEPVPTISSQIAHAR
jgi:hypothetical protein